MAANNVHISEALLSALQSRAEAAGKTVDEVAEEAVRRGLEERSWEDLIAYGLERGRASGHAEEDVPRIVRENRQQHR